MAKYNDHVDNNNQSQASESFFTLDDELLWLLYQGR
jgi:hypothetical protein